MLSFTSGNPCDVFGGVPTQAAQSSAASPEKITDGQIATILTVFGTANDLTAHCDALPLLQERGLIETMEPSAIVALREEIALANKAIGAVAELIQARNREAHFLTQVQSFGERVSQRSKSRLARLVSGEAEIAQATEKHDASTGRAIQIAHHIDALKAAETILLAQHGAVPDKQRILDSLKFAGQRYWYITAAGKRALQNSTASEEYAHAVDGTMRTSSPIDADLDGVSAVSAEAETLPRIDWTA